jgi:hypothetical protein
VLPFTLKCIDMPLSRPDTRTFMPTNEPFPPVGVVGLGVVGVGVVGVVVPEDGLWEEEPEAAKSVGLPLQAQSAALPMSTGKAPTIPNSLFGFIAHPRDHRTSRSHIHIRPPVSSCACTHIC